MWLLQVDGQWMTFPAMYIADAVNSVIGFYTCPAIHSTMWKWVTEAFLKLYEPHMIYIFIVFNCLIPFWDNANFGKVTVLSLYCTDCPAFVMAVTGLVRLLYGATVPSAKKKKVYYKEIKIISLIFLFFLSTCRNPFWRPIMVDNAIYDPYIYIKRNTFKQNKMTLFFKIMKVTRLKREERAKNLHSCLYCHLVALVIYYSMKIILKMLYLVHFK